MALGLDSTALPGWWQGWPPRLHVQRWRDELGLTEAEIVAVAEASRQEHPEPPDGPKTLDRAMQRAAQRKVDGGQHKLGSYTHPDAEVIAATVAGMPYGLGSKRMAIRVAELARAGLTPDWMPGAIPRCVPVEVKRNQHGDRATTIVVGTERVLTRGKWRSVEVLACPVTWRPHPEQIASARRGYDDWWQALDWVRDGLIAGARLREVEVTAAMPKAMPWKTG